MSIYSLTTVPTKEICCYDRSIKKVLYRQSVEGPKTHQGLLEVIPRRGLDEDFKVGVLMNENVFVSGASGSGKTTVIREYATNYKRINPDNSVYLVTQSREDNLPDFCRVWTANKSKSETYEEYLDLKYIDFTYFQDSEKIDITKDYHNSLIIFDDFMYYVGESKKDTDLIRQRVVQMILQILNLGRKVSCSAIISSHLLYDRRMNDLFQNIYCEINKFIFSVKSNRRQLLYVFKTYWGLTNKEIDDLMTFDPQSYMITLSKDPNFVLSSNRIILK
jgi:hypothetical protein